MIANTADALIVINEQGALIEKLRSENAQLEQEKKEIKAEFHRTVVLFVQQHKGEFEDEVKKQYHYLDKLAKKVENLDLIINVHKKLGGK